MASERLTESDINRLRGVVGLGTGSSAEKRVSGEKIIPPPVNNLIHEEPRPHVSGDTELFVKIDEHTEVAKELIKAKIDIKSIADTISLLGKAEKLKAEAIKRLESHLNELDNKLEGVERRLVAPEGLDMPGDTAELEYSSDISGLHSTLEKLKNEFGYTD